MNLFVTLFNFVVHFSVCSSLRQSFERGRPFPIHLEVGHVPELGRYRGENPMFEAPEREYTTAKCERL